MAEQGIATGGRMEVSTALQEVLKTLIHDGLACGICQTDLCVFESNSDEHMYVKLVEALCAEQQINLIRVNDNRKLGEWVSLCKTHREGKSQEGVGCSCPVLKDYGKESQANDVIKKYFKCKTWIDKV